MRVLFVCLGNICRSPAAEGVLVGLAEKHGLGHQLTVDSAGTGDWHVGSLADPRMRKAASVRGFELTHRARQIVVKDLEHFDHIFTMDEHNYKNVLALTSDTQLHQKVRPFVSLLSQTLERIPDPYYGDLKGFDHVLDLLEDGCGNLLKNLRDLQRL